VPPHVRYGMTYLLIRDVVESVSCSNEWEIGIVTHLGSHGAGGAVVPRLLWETLALQDGKMCCLSGRDLSDYDYVSVGQHGFVPMNVKPTTVGRLENVGIANDEERKRYRLAAAVYCRLLFARER
jgi:hypothetical protein